MYIYIYVFATSFGGPCRSKDRMQNQVLQQRLLTPLLLYLEPKQPGKAGQLT